MLDNIMNNLYNLQKDLRIRGNSYSIDDIIDSLYSIMDTGDNTVVALNEDKQELEDKISKLEEEIKVLKEEI